MKRKQIQGFPRCVTLKREEIQPDMATAVNRWRDVGELPPSAILCEYVGSADHKRKECYRNVETGALVDASELETISYVNVAKESPKKSYMIFGSPVDTGSAGK